MTIKRKQFRFHYVQFSLNALLACKPDFYTIVDDLLEMGLKDGCKF